MADQAAAEAALAVLGMTMADVDRINANRKHRIKRDARVCVCGHAAGAHFPSKGSPDDRGDIASYAEGEVACQAGKTPCACEKFQYVLTISDVRSFIQKTTGPGEEHALAKGLASSLGRGIFPEWREDIACFWCGKHPAEVGTLIPIAYNERGVEAFRPTKVNRLHCASCRAEVARRANGGS